jgi:membrane-associated HD superfamily phosphohydrolase
MKKLFVISMLFCCPLLLLATRGSDDYGIVLALMAMLFSVPFGIMLIGFIIYLIVVLNNKKKPEKKQGKVAFILSIITIILSIIIQIFWTYWADKHWEMFVLMSGDFVPIILLACISIVLARFVRKRARKIDNDIAEVN